MLATPSGSTGPTNQGRLTHFDFIAGQLAGTQSFRGTVNWTGGSWSTASSGFGTTIAEGALLDIGKPSASGIHDFSFRNITDQGIVNWNAGDIHAGFGSVFQSNTAFFDKTDGGAKLDRPMANTGIFVFNNAGSSHKTDAGPPTVGATFNNSGTSNVSKDKLEFTDTFASGTNGSLVLTNNATASFVNAVVFGAQSNVRGGGMIVAPMGPNAGETASPGMSPGALAVEGHLTLLATTTLLIELSGTGGPGVGHNQLNVTGTLVLGGATLDVKFFNGFEWTVPSSFTAQVVTAGSVLGAFGNAPSGQRFFANDNISFLVNYGPNSPFGAHNVVLSQFVAVPEPSTYALIGVGALVILISLRRRKR